MRLSPGMPATLSSAGFFGDQMSIKKAAEEFKDRFLKDGFKTLDGKTEKERLGQAYKRGFYSGIFYDRRSQQERVAAVIAEEKARAEAFKK